MHPPAPEEPTTCQCTTPPATAPSPPSRIEVDASVWVRVQAEYDIEYRKGTKPDAIIRELQLKYSGLGPISAEELWKCAVAKPPTPTPKPTPKPPTPTPKPPTPTPPKTPEDAIVADNLADFGKGRGIDKSLVFPRGAAPEIDNITQIAKGHFRFELRMRGDPWSPHNPRGKKGAWYDGDRDLKWNEGRRDGEYHDKSRAEVHDLFRDTPRGPDMKVGQTWDIATTVKLDNNFVPSDSYCNIMQPVFDQSFLNLTGIKGDDITAQLMVFTNGIGSQIKIARTFTIRRGVWTSIIVRVKFSKDGKYEVSVDGDAFKGIGVDTSKQVGGSKWGLYSRATTNVLGKPMKDLIVEHRDIYVCKV